MASIIWCDRARHVVREPHDEIVRLIAGARHGNGFAVFTLEDGCKRAMRVSAITSYGELGDES